MISLQEVLRVGNGLPAQDLHTLLFARKLAGNSKKFLKATVTGYPCILENSAGKPVVDYRIYGNSVQNGTPSPESPVEVQSVGQLVTEGENSGKYAIPVISESADVRKKTTVVYLDAPLRKIGDYSDKIDFADNRVTRYIGKIVYDGSEDENLFVPTASQPAWKRYPIGNMTNSLANAPVISAISDKIPTNMTSETQSGNISLRKGDGNSNIWFFVPFDMQGMETTDKTDINNILENFRIWLSDNPVTVYYPLASPTKETLILPKIPTFSGLTTIKTDTEIQPSGMEITYKERFSK